MRSIGVVCKEHDDCGRKRHYQQHGGDHNHGQADDLIKRGELRHGVNERLHRKDS